MKISYYDLLGMVKEGNAPKKIEVSLTYGTSRIYKAEYDGIDGDFSYYYLESNEDENYRYYLSECFLESNMFDKRITILDEEEFEEIKEFGISYNLEFINYKDIEILKKYLNKDFQTIYDTLDLLIRNQKKMIEKIKELEK